MANGGSGDALKTSKVHDYALGVVLHTLMRAVCMRASSMPRRTSQAWSQATEQGWIVFAAIVSELKARQRKEENAEALGIV
eukprot:2862979-Pleurochrysis_carterae.AAC.2